MGLETHATVTMALGLRESLLEACAAGSQHCAHSTVGEFLDCLQEDAVNATLHYSCMFPLALELNLGGRRVSI